MLDALCVCLAMLSQQDPGPGISRQLAVARRQLLRDIDYQLRFRIEPGAAQVDGAAQVRFLLAEAAPPDAAVVLDFAGELLDGAQLNGQDFAARPVDGHLVLPPAALLPGWNEFTARFRSAIAPTGTPLTVYRDPQDQREYYYTLVVPADAHRLYPCFDQPDLRARFQLELQLPRDWVAIANAAPLADQPQLAGSAASWRFATTRALPTYLMAFACGPFASFAAPLAGVPGIAADQPLRVFHRPSQAERIDRAALSSLHERGLRWLAGHFGVPYAFDKLDVVLLPGFPYGGMEHAGAIFYRETALVFDHPPTAAELARRSTLIYHELAHQWFGNLVTMKWFDDLWLKEGFATFVAYQALEALEPEQRAWLRFLQRVKPRAYEVDATPGTTPIYQELGNLADAKSAYGAIVYNKAPAVLRALHERIGPVAFRSGLRRYLVRHAFGAADWQDLAAALADADRQGLGRWSERWLLAPSMPQVRIDTVVDARGVVQSATLAVRSDQPALPLDSLVGAAVPAALLANPRDVAYGQFVPDPRTAQWLLANLPAEPEPLLRAAAASALFEAVRAAELDPLAFGELCLALLARETDADSHAWLLDALATCLQRYLPADRGAPLLGRAEDLLLAQLEDGEASGRELSIFRCLARTSGDARVLRLCRAVCRGPLDIAGLTVGKQDRFLAAAALLAAGDATVDLDAMRQAHADQDVAKELFLAAAAAADASTKARYWQCYLQRDEPPEQWLQDSLEFFHWRGQEALTLPYLRPALDRALWVKQHRRIFFMPAWLDAFVNGHSSPAALAIVDAFLATAELPGDVRQKLLQSRDGLARAVRIRAAFDRR